MALSQKRSIHCGAVSYIISLRHKKESIRFDTAIEGKYQENTLCRCVTRRRASIMELSYKKEGIHYVTAPQEGEYPFDTAIEGKYCENTLCRCVARRRASIMELC